MNLGCNAACKGPGCEAEWPTTRVVVHSNDSLRRSTDAWSDAIASYDGLDAHGARWRLATLGRTLLFGQPEVGQVLRVPFRLSDGPWERLDKWTGPKGFGAAVASIDVYDEGGPALLVGAPDAEFGRGAVYVFPDATSGPVDADDAPLEIRGGTTGDRLGEHLEICADLTGDGRPEILVSMPWFTTPTDPLFRGLEVPDLAGGVVMLTSEALLAATGVVSAWDLGPVWWGVRVGDGAGLALACDHDLDGDGVADVAIGAPWHEPNDSDDNHGRVYVLGGAALPPTGPLDADSMLTVIDGEPGEWLGLSLAMLELDGELPAELAVGGPGYDGGAGRLHIYQAQSLTREFAVEPLVTFTYSDDSPVHFGRWLAAGDLDADGLSDLLVGAPDLQSGRNGFDTGRAWTFRGTSQDLWLPDDTQVIADERVLGNHAFQRVGRAPVLHDLDGDGRDEVLLPTRREARQD